MRTRPLLAILAMAAGIIGLLATPANADHTKGKKYLDIELTTAAAEVAGDNFGVAPAGSSGEGAMYLNHGKGRFCLFLDFELPESQVVALHLHEKVPGTQNGPVVIQASDLLAEDGLSASGCIEDRELRAEIRGVLSEPGEYYINAHVLQADADDDTLAENGMLPVVRTEIGRN